MLHKAQAFLARLLNLPVLLFLALRLRILSSSLSSSSRRSKLKQPAFFVAGGSIISQTARGAQKAFERLTDYDWDEGGEAVRKVFEFEIEERVYKTEDERLEENRTKRDVERREREEEEQDEDETTAKIVQRQKEKAKEQVKRSGGWDLKTLVGAKAEASRMKPSKTADARRDDGQVGGTMSKGLEDRLERIEDALEILLTEMVRNRRLADGQIEGTATNAPAEL